MKQSNNAQCNQSKFPLNPWVKMDEKVHQDDIFTETHEHVLLKVISMSNNLVAPLTKEGDIWGFLEAESKDKGIAETKIAPRKPHQDDDVAMQHSSPSAEDNRLGEKIIDVTVLEQKMTCESEDSTHSRSYDVADASPHSVPEAPVKQNPKCKNERRETARTEAKGKRATTIAQARLTQMVEESIEEGAPKTKKKDQRKNMYGYSFKHIIRELFSDEYKAFLAKLCIKHGVSDPQDIVSFYREKLLWSISLSNVLTLLDYEAHPVDSTEHKVIKAFHSFYVWYMRKRYVLHIMNSTEIEHKEEYLEATRSLIYLPRIKKSKLNNLLVNQDEQ